MEETQVTAKIQILSHIFYYTCCVLTCISHKQIGLTSILTNTYGARCSCLQSLNVGLGVMKATSILCNQQFWLPVSMVLGWGYLGYESGFEIFEGFLLKTFEAMSRPSPLVLCLL